MDVCSKCGHKVEFFQSHCRRCETFHSCPNVRAAAAEAAELDSRCESARDDAAKRNATDKLGLIEGLATKASAVLNVSVPTADNLLRGDKYRNYYQSLDAGTRSVAEANHHSARQMVDGRFFPNYHQHIAFMALSPDGQGLTSYGSATMRIDNQEFLALRASLLERNTYHFYDDHYLGDRKRSIPVGYRSNWNERSKLAISKLAGRVNTSSGVDNVRAAFFTAAGDRDKDEFIEVHVYMPGGIAREEWTAVALQKPLTDPDDQDRWQLVVRSCKNLGIKVVP
jgi:hypothetical protein